MALRKISELIKKQKNEDENNPRFKIKSKTPKLAQKTFVAVFADGGSNNPASTMKEIKAIRDQGYIVYGFGITNSAQAMKAVYAPDAVIVPKSSDLAAIGLNALTKTIKNWYNIK